MSFEEIGTIIIFLLLIAILYAIFKWIISKSKLKTAEERLNKADEREKELDKREEELREKLEKEYEQKKEELKKQANRQLKNELDKVAGLPTEEIIKRYGKLLRNNRLDSLWDL